MTNNLFMSIRCDIGSDFKIRVLCKKFGMEALAWWVLTLAELTCEDGLLCLDDEIAVEIFVEKFSTSEETLFEFFGKCADLGLIDKPKWEVERKIFSESLYSEIEYRKARSEIGRKAGQASGKARR